MSSASPMHEKWILLRMLPLNHWGEMQCPQLLISGPGGSGACSEGPTCPRAARMGAGAALKQQKGGSVP